VQESGSEDSLEQFQDSLEEVILGDDVRVDLHNNAGSGCDSGLQNLVVNTDDLGQANFVMSVGALGNASGTPLDRSHDMSFGESTVGKEYIVDEGEDETSIVAEHNVPTANNQNDPIMDPEMIGALMSRCSVVDPRSPTLTVQFNEQVAVQHCYLEAQHLHLGRILPRLLGTQEVLNHLTPRRVIPRCHTAALHRLNPWVMSMLGIARVLLVRMGITGIREVRMIAMVSKVQLPTETIWRSLCSPILP